MRTIAYAALCVASIGVGTACGGKASGSGAPQDQTSGAGTASSSPGPGDASTPTGQPLVYFYANPLDGGAIYGVPAGGGAPVKLLSGDATHEIFDVLTFDARNIYYSSLDHDAPALSYSLRSVPIAGGAPTALSSLLGSISGIAVDANNVYFGVETDTLDDAGYTVFHGEIHSVPIAGGSQQVLATAAAGLGGVAVDATHVYWTTSGSVLKTPIVGGATETLASGQLNSREVAVDAVGVYWIDYGTVGTDCTSTDGSLWELAVGSSAPVNLASSLHAPGSLAVAGADAYWSEGGAFCNVASTPEGSVSKHSGATGTTSRLVSAINGPSNLYVGGSMLYFTKLTDHNALAPVITNL
jgi:hypothetical protein